MKHRSLHVFMLLQLLTIAGCKKFVEVEPPRYQQTTNNVFKNNVTANSALITIYAQMISESASGYHIALYTGLASDELAQPPDNYALEMYINAVNPNRNIYSSSFWEAAYRYIYQANMAYENCDKATILDPAVKKQLMAEALFIRAYWHFYLLNIFGDIPLVTSSDYTKNMVLPRAPAAKVYEQIVTDLKKAQADLSISYVGADCITPTDERVRPNQAAATAFLARVYLYMEKYKEAEDQATAVINLAGAYALVEPGQVFLKNNKEAIWQLMAPKENFSCINTPEGKNFIITELDGLNKQSDISMQLYHAFEDGDLRKTFWVGLYQKYHFPFKYKVKLDSILSEYSVVFRLAEQYLIRAECRAQLGKLMEAISDVDMIRKRAGLPLLADTHAATDKTDLLNAVLKERQIELFAEQGHRWFDLKRTKTVDATMRVVTPLKGGIWKTEMQVWPLPYTELMKNPNLKQNPGYN
jgi:tetratricopeptide (TPR) repeat protein